VAAVTLTSVGIIQSAELSVLDVQGGGIRAASSLRHLPEQIAVGVVGSQVVSIIIENGRDTIIQETAVESGSLQSRILVDQSAGSF
jgi:tryptophan synthase alpha subunit